MMEGKLHKQNLTIKTANEESKETINSPIKFQEAIRLPNLGTLKSALEGKNDSI